MPQPAPGMQAAMAILTARVQSMEGTCTTEDYVAIIRDEMQQIDPVILTSALATLAYTYLSINSGATGQSVYDLLGMIGLALADETM